MKAKIRPVTIKGDIVEITLTCGLIATVDLVDLPLVENRNWSYYETTNRSGIIGSIGNLRLHRLISGAKRRQYVEFVDGNILNNRRSNLRVFAHLSSLPHCRGAEPPKPLVVKTVEAPKFTQPLYGCALE